MSLYKDSCRRPLTNAFIDKLRGHAALSGDDLAVLADECQNARDVPARHDLIREGDETGPLFVMLSGWACRYQILPEGGRQITAFPDAGRLLRHARVRVALDGP